MCIGGSALSVEYECAVWPQSADFEGAVWFGGNSRMPRNMFRVTEGGRMLRYERAGWFGSGAVVDGTSSWSRAAQSGVSRKSTKLRRAAKRPVKTRETRETHHRLFLAFDAANCGLDMCISQLSILLNRHIYYYSHRQQL